MCVRACVFVGKCTNQIQKKMIFYATFFFFSMLENLYIFTGIVLVPSVFLYDGCASRWNLFNGKSPRSASFLYSEKKMVSPACQGRHDARRVFQSTPPTPTTSKTSAGNFLPGTSRGLCSRPIRRGLSCSVALVHLRRTP